MLDEYINEQPIVYKILKNAVRKNKYSHAYLFETNGYEKKEQLILAFAKYLLCQNSYSSNNNCVNCTQCLNIDNNNFLEIKIVRPDGLWIKKEQMDEIQREFKQKSIQSNKRVYIIYNSERMNSQASNSILKFLEEPEDNIIAILVTDNLNQILNTIISRCQNISLKINKNVSSMSIFKKIRIHTNVDNEIEDDKLNIIINKVINFINYYEQNKIDTLVNINKLWHNEIKEKDIILLSLNIIILYYKDILNLKINRKLEIFEKIDEKILKNTVTQLINKINIVNVIKEQVKVNVNNNLLMDKLVLALEGVK